jgi:hypothetical protein
MPIKTEMKQESKQGDPRRGWRKHNNAGVLLCGLC